MRAKNKEKNIYIYKLIVTVILALAVMFVLKVAPNYVRNEISDKTNLVINNGNVTKSLKNDVFVEDGVVYISTKDIANFFDDNIFYDNKYDQIITSSDTKLATLKLDEKKCTVNGADIKLIAPAKKIEEKFYLPFSEISKSVYNVETKYVPETNTVVLVSLDKALTYANSSKKNSVKSEPTIFSRTVDKIAVGDNVTVVGKSNENEAWTKVTTEDGKIGYVKTSSLANTKQIRSDLTIEKQIDGKISMIWDSFSKYGSAPSRTGKIEGVNVVSPTFFSLQQSGTGNIIANVGQEGEDYINWAHENGYKVWALLSNDAQNEATKNNTSVILNDYKKREHLINNIINAVMTFELDGINLDFEFMHEEDKDMYSRLVIELAPRLKELGKVLSVDVTAPDGSADWSLCFDRNTIGDVADYIVFMGYDQNTGGKKPGTNAGYDWVEENIKKFVNREEVDASKLILATPCYTRAWWTTSSGEIDSQTVYMKNTYDILPEGTQVQWDDTLKQNYAEYTKNGRKYQVWIEDKESIKCKLDLVNSYGLAGAAYWEKYGAPDELWDTVSESLGIK